MDIPDSAPAKSHRFRPWLEPSLATAVMVLAGLIRFIRLDIPRSTIPLDEFYYPVNALGLLKYGAEQQYGAGGQLEPAFAVHPPVGKWLIAAGMKIFGNHSFGWRFMAAVCGTLSVLILYLLVRRLTRSPWIAAGAATLLAVDGLQVVQSRIGMLDIFLSFFVLLAAWLLVEDAFRGPKRRTPGWRRSWRPRWWRVGSGVAIGLAAATKWSGAFVIPFLAGIALLFELLRMQGMLRPALDRSAAEDLPPVEEPLPAEGPLSAGESPPVEGAPGEIANEPGREGEVPLDAAAEPNPSGEAEVPEQPRWVWAPEDAPDSTLPEDAPSLESSGAMPATSPPGGSRRWSVPAILRQIGALAVTFGLIPLVIYVASYTPWFFAKSHRYTAPRCAAAIQFDGPKFSALRPWKWALSDPFNQRFWNNSIWPENWKSWVCYEREIFDYHKNLKSFDSEGKPIHPYLTRAWSWPWIGRPTAHYWDVKTTKITAPGTGDEMVEVKKDAEIVGIPNPAIWFPAFFLAFPLCAWWAFRKRDIVSATLVALFIPLYAPWLITPRPLFMFYMTPAVPFLILMLAHVISRMRGRSLSGIPIAVGLLALPFTPLAIQWCGTGATAQLLYKVPALMAILLLTGYLVSLVPDRIRSRRLGLIAVAMALAMFAYFYPVLAAVHISDQGVFGWSHHMWLQLDCGTTDSTIEIDCWI